MSDRQLCTCRHKNVVNEFKLIWINDSDHVNDSTADHVIGYAHTYIKIIILIIYKDMRYCYSSTTKAPSTLLHDSPSPAGS